MLFVCLFVIVLRPTQEYFTHMETSPYAGEGLQILAYTRHLWPLSSEGSLTCQHLLRHGTSSFTVSSEGQETDQCRQRDSNSRPHDPKSSALPTEPPGRLYNFEEHFSRITWLANNKSRVITVIRANSKVPYWNIWCKVFYGSPLVPNKICIKK